MGQYYKPVLLDDAGCIAWWFYSHDYDNGLKLMEHSWVGNEFVAAVAAMLSGGHYRMVWAGDYADPEPGGEHNLYELASCETGDDGERVPDPRKVVAAVYDRCGDLRDFNRDWYRVDPVNVEIAVQLDEPYRYLVNHDRGEYVDIARCPGVSTSPGNRDVWVIHPLPLLTCEGNGRGGGDFRSDDQRYVGRWARQRIQTVREAAPESPYTELRPMFLEAGSVHSGNVVVNAGGV